MIRDRRLLPLLLLAATAALFLAHAWIYRQWVEDDTFITLRYAENLAAGEGLVFNPGQRLEAYSNFAWVVLAAAARRLGLDPLPVLQGAGLLGGLLALPAAWLLARRLLPERPGTALLAPLLLALWPPLARHAVSGLETAAFAGLLAWSVLWAGEPRRRWLLVGLLLLLSLLRPEGVGFALLILAWRRWPAGERDPAPPLAFLGLFLVFLVWRWAYFGALLPNTFHFKMTGGAAALREGLYYCLDFLQDNGGVALVGGALALAALRPVGGLLRLIAVVIAAQGVLVLLAGGDWMHHYRFVAPVWPLLAATTAAGVGALTEAADRRRRAAVLAVALTLGIAWVGVARNERTVARGVLPALAADQYLWQGYREVGRWLAENTPSDAVVAISDVGAVGYYSQREILDMFGLIDAHIARRPGRLHFKNDPGYVLARQPDAVVLVAAAAGGYWRLPDLELSRRPEFRAGYEVVHRVGMGLGAETAEVYLRRGDSR